MDSHSLVSFLQSQVWQLPYLGMSLVGMCISIVLWRRHPQVSLVAAMAFSLSIASQFVWVGFGLWNFLGNPGSAAKYVAIFQCVSLLLYLPSQILLLMAVFGWRNMPLVDGREGHPEQGHRDSETFL